MQYENLLVKKPWGSEYILYQNSLVAIWLLYIADSESTSLHCHPNKKTGLVVLDGTAEISFLNDSKACSVGNKVMIRQGVFHKTKAIDGNLTLLEIETPVDKKDIVRLKDKYGRAGQPYEKEESCSLLKHKIALDKFPQKIGSCNLHIEHFYTKDALLERNHGIYMCISGGIVSTGNISVFGPGDIVTQSSLNKLITEFEINNLSTIIIDKCVN